MTKWEYLRLHVEYVSYLNRDDGKVKEISSNGNTIKSSDNKTIYLHEYINELGVKGWEMVSVYKVTEADIFYFKRELTE